MEDISKVAECHVVIALDIDRSSEVLRRLDCANIVGCNWVNRTGIDKGRAVGLVIAGISCAYTGFGDNISESLVEEVSNLEFESNIVN